MQQTKTVHTFFTENGNYYRAIITEKPENHLLDYPNHKETRKRDLNQSLVLFTISQTEYKELREAQRQAIRKNLTSNGFDEDLQLSDNLTNEQIDKLLHIKDNL